MKFDCEKCGKIDNAIMDGYSFGDRLLEGVKFLVTKNDNGKCMVEPYHPDDKSYLKTLNYNMWMKMAKESAETNDIFECPHCGSDVVPDDMLCEEDKS